MSPSTKPATILWEEKSDSLDFHDPSKLIYTNSWCWITKYPLCRNIYLKCDVLCVDIKRKNTSTPPWYLPGDEFIVVFTISNIYWKNKQKFRIFRQVRLVLCCFQTHLLAVVCRFLWGGVLAGTDVSLWRTSLWRSVEGLVQANLHQLLRWTRLPPWCTLGRWRHTQGEAGGRLVHRVSTKAQFSWSILVWCAELRRYCHQTGWRLHP